MQPDKDRAAALRNQPRPGRRFAGCLIWSMVLLALLALAALIVLAAAYAGWHSGIDLARAEATSAAAAESREQCQRADADIGAGNRQLAQARLQFLLGQPDSPPCLDQLIPSATALALASLHSATAPPTSTPMPTSTPSPTVVSPRANPAPTATATLSAGYDLDSLLNQARSDYRAGLYQRAIDTLDAIQAIDSAYQPEAVRALYFDALADQANALFRSGRLSEGIVLAGRAEAYGVLPDQLAGERNVAAMYLKALRLKQISPGDSVLLLRQIAYTYSSPQYMDVLAELQAAHLNYGDAYAFGGDACQAAAQYQAALDLQPTGNGIQRGAARRKLEETQALCLAATAPAAASEATKTGPAAIGVRP